MKTMTFLTREPPSARRDPHRDLLADFLDRQYGPLPEASKVGRRPYPLTYRTLTKSDLDQKAWVHSKTWRETYRGILPGPLVKLVSPDFARNMTLRHPFSHCVLALAGQRVIGFAEWVNTPRPPSSDVRVCSEGDEIADKKREPPVELAAIYLLRRYQRRGIGTRLFQALRQKAGSPHRMMLWVVTNNLPAQRFYTHLGFRPTGQVQREPGGMLEEAWLLH